MRRSPFATLSATLATAGFLVSSSVFAGVCGDDVDGKRVACACGDVVVSDVRLRPGDPVTSERCLHDGLIVRAAAVAESIDVDLGGQLIVGSGIGYGILVERGGSDGAAIIGGPGGDPGEIAGFSTGIHSPFSKGVRSVTNVRLVANERDGMRLNMKGAVIEDVATLRNGRTGLALRGTGGRVVGLESHENGNAGARITSRGTIVAGRAERNVRGGIVLGGARNDISGFVARENKGVGVAVHGGHHELSGFRAELNDKGDFRGPGSLRP